jgi:hypothetical protein
MITIKPYKTLIIHHKHLKIPLNHKKKLNLITIKPTFHDHKPTFIHGCSPTSPLSPWPPLPRPPQLRGAAAGAGAGRVQRRLRSAAGGAAADVAGGGGAAAETPATWWSSQAIG